MIDIMALYLVSGEIIVKAGIPGLKMKSQKTISFEGSLPFFFLKSISFRKERSLRDRKGRLP